MKKREFAFAEQEDLANATLRAFTETRFNYPYRPPPQYAGTFGKPGANGLGIGVAPASGTTMTTKRR